VTLLRVLVHAVEIVVHAALGALLAVSVACAVNDATTEDPPPTTTTGTITHEPRGAEGEPMPSVQPLLDHPIAPDGEPVPFRYREVSP